MIKCFLCRGSINPHDEVTWKEVVGVVGGPRKDSMRLRRDTGRYAHPECVSKAQQGQAIDQADIFEEEPKLVERKPTPALPTHPVELRSLDDLPDTSDDLPF